MAESEEFPEPLRMLAVQFFFISPHTHTQAHTDTHLRSYSIRSGSRRLAGEIKFASYRNTTRYTVLLGKRLPRSFHGIEYYVEEQDGHRQYGQGEEPVAYRNSNSNVESNQIYKSLETVSRQECLPIEIYGNLENPEAIKSGIFNGVNIKIRIAFYRVFFIYGH